MHPITTDIVALLGGLIPALLWLSFWLLEDRCKPEPKLRLFFTFVAGMAAVAVVLPLERLVIPYLGAGVALLLVWAATEELFKFGASYLTGLRSRFYDEPIDAVVYLITAALGFSAMENALFLLEPLQNGSAVQGLITGNLRFIGATLLHTLSAAIIGLSIAFAFYRSRSARIFAGIAGLILAIALHTLFNFLILNTGGAITFSVFVSIWIGIVAVLFLIERVKALPRRQNVQS